MRNSSVRRGRLSRNYSTVAAIGLLLAAGLVRADAGDTLNFIAGETVRYEDNLFRLPSDIDPLLVTGKPTRSDQLTVTYVGIQFDKSYSQQAFHADVTQSRYRYKTYSYLNFDPLAYAASWKWHLTGRLSGNASIDQKTAQADFSDHHNIRGNKTTSENSRVDADWWLHGSWHLTGGVWQSKYRNSTVNVAEGDLDQRSGNAGVRYVAESGSSLTLLSRTSRGDYPNQPLNAAAMIDTGYKQADIEVQAAWLISGQSSLNGRLTHLERNYDHFAERDYGGTAGRFDYTLTPSGKLQFKLSAVRNIASYVLLTSSYYVDDSLAFAPVWQISSKTALRLNLQRSQRDYLGGAPVPLPVTRHDQSRSALLSLDWAPMRALSLSASLQNSSRNSNEALQDYKDNTASITAQLSF